MRLHATFRSGLGSQSFLDFSQLCHPDFIVLKPGYQLTHTCETSLSSGGLQASYSPLLFSSVVEQQPDFSPITAPATS